jgi:hypothetical protein
MRVCQGMSRAALLVVTLYPHETLAVPPAAPSSLAARSVSSSQIDLTWVDNANNEINFQLQFARNAAFTGSTRRNIGPADITQYSHSGLSPATTYWYRLKANGSGGSPWSNTAVATTAPGGVVATAVSSSAIDVSWTPNPANPTITGYTVRYGTAADFSNAVYKWVAGNGSSTYSAIGLAADQAYYVSVKAEGSNPSAFSSPANATTPAAPSGTPISPLFFGQNAWLPLRIGDHDYFGDLEELLCGPSYTSGGSCVPAEVQASGVKLMRYGGIGVDNHYDDAESPDQYLTLVDNLRTNGIEPLLQVPYPNGPTTAADLVRHLNVTHGRGVRYWTIGNEPSSEYGAGADAIAAYFKAFVVAMREVDPTIVIVGPDLNWYDPTIMDPLTTPNGPHDLCGGYLGADGDWHHYLDIVAFHTYPFDGTQTRAEVIARPQGSFQGNLTALKARVDECNRAHARTGTSALKMAVTEINVEYRNPADLSLGGVSAQSFLAGQFWADVLNVGMKHGLEFVAFWSVKEGNPQLGYIGSNGVELPTYYHYQMLAQNFRGRYAAGTHLVNGAGEPNVKAFGAKDHDQIVVVILNEKQNTPLAYTVRLDTGAVSGGNALKVNIDAGVGREYSNPPGETLAAQSTVMLVFDGSGTLRARHVYGLSSGTAAPSVFGY